MKRKLVSILTALALCLSLCPIWAFAAEEEPCQPHGLYGCAVCPIEDLIAALPEQVTEDNAADVRGQLDEILALYRELSEDEQGLIDLSLCMDLQAALDADLTDDTEPDFGQLDTPDFSQPTLTAEGDGVVTTVEQLTAAINQANGGATVSVQLEGDIMAESTLTLSDGNLTLDLNGHKLSSAQQVIKVSGGTFILKDSSSDGSGSIEETGKQVTIDVDGGEAIINSGTVSNNDSSTRYTIDVSNGTLTVNNGTIHNENGPAIYVYQNASVIINGGDIKSDSGNAIYVSHETASLTVSGETTHISGGGGGSGIYAQNARSIQIEGGTIKGTGAGAQGLRIGTVGTVALSGGTFLSEGYNSIKIESSSDYSTIGSLLKPCNEDNGEHWVYTQNGTVVTTGLDNANLPGTVTVTPCTGTLGAATNNSDGTHTGACTVCTASITEACTFQYEGNSDGTHTRTCTKCNDSITEACTFQYIDNGNGTHTRTCTACNAVISGPHAPDGDSAVCVCGAALAAKIEKTDGTTTYVTSSDIKSAFYTKSGNDGATFTLLRDVETSLSVSIDCTLDLNGHNISWNNTGASITVSSGNIMTIQGEGQVSSKFSYALDVAGTAVLRGGTYVGGYSEYDGERPAIHVWPNSHTLADLLGHTDTTRYAYYQNDTPVNEELDGKNLYGTVTVKPCDHSAANFTNNGDGTHTSTCPACGQTGDAENCAYTFSGTTGTCAACKDSVTVAVSGNPVYDGTTKTPDVTVTRGGTALTEGYTVKCTNNTNAGEATVTVTIGSDQGKYEGTFTIGRATPTITWSSATQELTYTGEEAAITEPTVTLVNGEQYSGKIIYSYQKQGETEYRSGLPIDTGTYTIKAHVNAEGNYTAADSGEMTLTISPSPVTLTFNDQTIAYGGTPTEATAVPANAVIKYSYTGTGTTVGSGDGWPVNAGTYTVTAKVEASGNYGEATATATLTINKAAYTGTKTDNTSGKYGTTKTYDLADLQLPDGYVLGAVSVTDSNSIFRETPTLSGTKLTYKLVDDSQKKDSTGTISIPVTSTNYEDFLLTITVKVLDKYAVTLDVPDITITYGQTPQIQGTATGGDGKTLTGGTWSFKGTVPTDFPGDKVTVVFEPADADKENYQSPAEKEIRLNIEKAPLSGTPTFSKVTGSGKTLADVTLTVPSGWPAGDFAWTDGDGTAVEQGKAYAYIFTPYSENYQPYTGSATPWERPVDPPTPPVVSVTGVRLNRSSLTLKPGESFHLTETVEPSNATQKDVTWSSSNPTVAEVDGSGSVIARTPGTAVITVRTVSGGRTAACTVTVEAPEHVHKWDSAWHGDSAHHWHECLADGCEITGDSGKDGYGAHVYDDEQDEDCNICGHMREVEPPELETYTITYNANGGAGTMAAGTAIKDVPFILPACGFMAPEGKVFDTWHIGGTSGTSVKPGEQYTFTADTVVRAVWKDAPAAAHHVTFLPNGGAGTAPTMADMAEGSTFRLPDSPFSRVGYQFSGWSYGGVIYAAGTMFTMPDNDVTFTAQWTQLAYAITGKVLQDGAGVLDAIVTLMRGTQTVATGRTDANGRFTFSGIPVGTYNLRADKDGITKTVKQEITSGSADLTIILPAGKTNSVVEVKNEETPPVVVGGLDQVFEDTSVYTPEEQEAVNKGGAVEFKLTVEKQDAPPEAVKIETVKKENETVALYLDLTLTRTVTHSDGTGTSTEIPEVGTLIETIVPLPAEMQGKASYTVYRVHNGVAEPLPQDKGDEYYTVSRDKTSISIFARKYSTYAIAWSDEAETPPTPPTPSRPTGGGGGSSVRTYAVTVEKSEHGKVTANRTNASSGTTVALTVTPDTGYVLLDLAVTDSQGNLIRVTDQNTFTMPSRAVTVKASFAPLPDESQEKPCDGGADCPSRAYADLSTGTWYHEAVDYAIQEGLLTGYGNGTFNPNGNLSRAMLAQILYNRAGRPGVRGGSSFMDVAPDSWYADAVTWAAAQGIAGGYGNGRFGPNDSITREQLAVMLWRYSKESAATDKELHFSDANQASSWALEALRWAAEKGILNGKGNGILDPGGLTSRAETAQIFHNLFNK